MPNVERIIGRYEMSAHIISLILNVTFVLLIIAAVIAYYKQEKQFRRQLLNKLDKLIEVTQKQTTH